MTADHPPFQSPKGLWRRHPRLRWVVLLALAAAVAGAWWTMRPAPKPAAPPSAAAEVADIAQVVQAAGVLQARTRVDVGAQVSGQIKTLHVQLGQDVKKGDLLVSLDPELALNEVARAEAALQQQRALLDARQVDLATARRERERQRRLLAGDATAALEAERAESDLAKLEADVRGQSAVLTRLQADLAQAQVRLGYTRIIAPMDGTVVNIPVQAGQTVIAVQITPVMLTLADLDTITIRTKIPEADIQAVKVGQTARFSTLSGESRRYEGRLRVIQPIPERVGNAVFYNVLFEVDNRDRLLYSDMTVQVDVQTGRAEQVLSIPMVALGERDSEGRWRVSVLDEQGQHSPRWVKTGLQDGARIQVLDGLKAGEKVLLAPPPPESAASAAGAKGQKADQKKSDTR